MLKWIATIYDLISCLCKAYKLNVESSPFIPHCTIMKLSKLKGYERKKLLKYNKSNNITLQSSYNHLGGKKNDNRRRENKVYDFNILSAELNDDIFKHRLKAVTLFEDSTDGALFENVTKIDFCAMLGSHLTEDGYYKIIHSLFITLEQQKMCIMS